MHCLFGNDLLNKSLFFTLGFPLESRRQVGGRRGSDRGDFVNPETNGFVSLFQTSAQAALGLDAGLALALVAAKVLLVALAVLAVARKQAFISLKKCIGTVLTLGVVYFLCNTTPEAILTLRPFVLVVLCGSILFRKLFETNLEKSFVACLLFCFISIMMDGHVNQLADKLIPGRVTIGSWLTTAIDDQLRKSTENNALPPSTGVMPALIRASGKMKLGGFIEALTTPIRMGLQAKEQITKIKTTADERVALAEGLAAGDTNAEGLLKGTHAPGQGLAGAALAPTGSVPVATNTMPFPAPTVSTSAPPAQASPTPEVVATPPATNAAALATNRPPAPPAAPPPGPTGKVISRVATDKLGDLNPKDRERWQKAQQKIVVSGVGRSGQMVYALIGGRMIRQNQTYSISHMGLTYTFQFHGLDGQGACQWDPVLEDDKESQFTIAF